MANHIPGTGKLVQEFREGTGDHFKNKHPGMAEGTTPSPFIWNAFSLKSYLAKN